MTVRQLAEELVSSQNGALGIKWVLVGSEAQKKEHIEAVLEHGYECSCGNGDSGEQCLSTTTIVIDADEAKMMTAGPMLDEASLGVGTMPFAFFALTGNLAIEVAEGMKMALTMAGIMHGLDPQKFSQLAFEEALESLDSIENIDDFLGDVLGGGEL
jgi:hypothetical protein